jgi:4'-phosphopantetheinyl transferase
MFGALANLVLLSNKHGAQSVTCVDPKSDLRIWVAELDRGAADLTLLSEEERERAARLARPQDRKWWLEAHCALRRVLGRQLSFHPRRLKFGATATGKPYVAEPAGNLQFSLSHSGANGLIATAVGRSVGVDIEVEQPMSDLREVALQFATPHEAKLLMSRSGSQLRAAFYGLWTRKEALLKAAGTGLLVDPREVEAGIGPDRRHVSFEGRSWTLASLAVGPGLSAAVAVEGVLETPPIVILDCHDRS